MDRRGNPARSVDISVVGGVYVGLMKTVGENSWGASSLLCCPEYSEGQVS